MGKLVVGCENHTLALWLTRLVHATYCLKAVLPNATGIGRTDLMERPWTLRKATSLCKMSSRFIFIEEVDNSPDFELLLLNFSRDLSLLLLTELQDIESKNPNSTMILGVINENINNLETTHSLSTNFH